MKMKHVKVIMNGETECKEFTFRPRDNLPPVRYEYGCVVVTQETCEIAYPLWRVLEIQVTEVEQ